MNINSSMKPYDNKYTAAALYIGNNCGAKVEQKSELFKASIQEAGSHASLIQVFYDSYHSAFGHSMRKIH